MRTPLSAFPIELTIASPGSVTKSDLADIEKEFARKIESVEALVKTNQESICYLMDFYCDHAPYLEALDESPNINALGKMSSNQRRSLYARLSKTKAWQDNPSLQISQDEFKKLCEMAKVLCTK